MVKPRHHESSKEHDPRVVKLLMELHHESFKKHEASVGASP